MSSLMKCGHAPNAIDGDGRNCCVICMCAEPADSAPDLTNRKAVCVYGNHKEVASSFDLAFFEYKKDKEKDNYYCGCYGWD